MSSGDTGREADGLVKEAKAFLGQRQYDRADEAASRAIGLDPKSPTAYLVRAETRRKLGRPDQALADLAVSIRLDPDRAASYVVRAEVLKKRCLFDQAIADATHALFLAPDNAAAYSIRADCRRAIGDLNGAAADAQELVRIDPTRPLAPEGTGPGQDDRGDIGRFYKEAGTDRPDLRGDNFEDGKPADRSMKSKVIDDPDKAAESLAQSSGYKPGVIIRSSPKARSYRGRPSRQAPWVMIVLGGAMLLGLIGGGSVLVNHYRGAEGARSKYTAGQASVASTAVRTQDGRGSTSNPPEVPGDEMPAASRVAQATSKAHPEPDSTPPPVVGSSVHLQEVAELGGSDRKVWWLDLNEAGTRVVSAEDRHLKLLDFRSGFQELKPTFLCSNDGSVSGIMTAAFLPDSENVVTGHYNGEVRVWDTRRRPPSVGKVIKKFPDLVPWVAVSPDGKLVATGVRKLGQVDLWRNGKGDLTHLAAIAAKEECN